MHWYMNSIVRIIYFIYIHIYIYKHSHNIHSYLYIPKYKDKDNITNNYYPVKDIYIYIY